MKEAEHESVATLVGQYSSAIFQEVLVKSVLAAFMLGMCVAACGSSPSPTTPAAPSTTSTRIIGLSGNLAFGGVAVGQTATATLTITNNGNSTLTVSGMTVPSGSGSVYASSFLNGTIAAGGSQPATIKFAPTAGQSYSGTLTVNGDQTSGLNTISISGNGTVPLFTVAGVLSEASGGAPISGANVRINDGPYVGQSSSTDGNGYYSIAGINGAISLVGSKAGYDNAVRFLTVSTDTRFDMTMVRTAPAPPPPTSRYRVGATCNDGTSSSATGSRACSSHGGVRCWRYSDGTCTNP